MAIESFAVSSRANAINSFSTAPLCLQKMAKTSLVIWGKEAEEKELAINIKKNGALKINGEEQLLVFLPSDLPAAVLGTPTFKADSYFRTTTTIRFGQFLLWSPRLPSTHDVVSQNFCNLPTGSVCVADVQFKGRGGFFFFLFDKKV